MVAEIKRRDRNEIGKSGKTVITSRTVLETRCLISKGVTRTSNSRNSESGDVWWFDIWRMIDGSGDV